MPMYAIGDIHGHLDKLEYLLSILPLEEDDLLVFLGDYVDRGPNSRGVISRLVQLQHEKQCVFLMGNHEEMFRDYVLGCKKYDGKLWALARNGGMTTLMSYRATSSRPGEVPIPQEHLDFLNSLLPHYVADGFVFVHAGLTPGMTTTATKLGDKLWIRDEFVSTVQRWEEGVVVFGHTPFLRPLVHDNKIGIDTDCARGGPLTAVRLSDMAFFQTPTVIHQEAFHRYPSPAVSRREGECMIGDVQAALFAERADLQRRLQRIREQMAVEVGEGNVADTGHASAANLLASDLAALSTQIAVLPDLDSVLRTIVVNNEDGTREGFAVVESGSGGKEFMINGIAVTLVSTEAATADDLLTCAIGDELPDLGAVQFIDNQQH